MKKIKEENRGRYSADFETLVLTQEQIEAGARTYVWAWASCLCKDVNQIEYGTSIDTFFEYVKTLPHGSILYFHNEKFDGSFILNYLLSKGYKQVHCKKYDLPVNSFTTIVSGMGVFYSIDLNIDGKLYSFYDSLKKLPFKVSELAKQLKYEEGKGEIDYEAYREEGGVLSDEDKDYIRRDVQIVGKALQSIYFDNNMYKMTIGSDCMKFFKDNLKQYGWYFPQLDPKEDKFARFAYRGGWCWCNPKYAGLTIDYKIVNKVLDTKYKEGDYIGIVDDKNSMYSSHLHSVAGHMYPVGAGVYYEGDYIKDNTYPLYIQHIRCAFQLKEGHVPFVQMKNNMLYKQNEYITTTEGNVEDLYLTSVDLEQFKKHYKYWVFDEDIQEYEPVDGYKYQGVIGLFDNYINYWYKVKEEATKTGNKVMRLLSKLMLNNLYGRLALNPEGSYMTFELKDGKLSREPIPDTRESVYVPAAAFCTAYARQDIVNCAQDNYNRVLYVDTDSLHLIGDYPAKNVPIHPTALNYWDCEDRFKQAKYLRQKTYAELVTKYDKDKDLYYDEWDFKCAGLPDPNSKLNIDNFYIGSVLKGAKKLSKQVPGGIVLVPTDFKIKDI